MQKLSWHDISLRYFDVQYFDNLQQAKTEDPCPIFTPHKQPPEANVEYFGMEEKTIYSRQPLIPMLKHHPTFIIWTYDINKVIFHLVSN